MFLHILFKQGMNMIQLQKLMFQAMFLMLYADKSIEPNHC